MIAASTPAKRLSRCAGDEPNGRCEIGQPSSVRSSEPGAAMTPSVPAAVEYSLESHQVIVG